MRKTTPAIIAALIGLSAFALVATAYLRAK